MKENIPSRAICVRIAEEVRGLGKKQNKRIVDPLGFQFNSSQFFVAMLTLG